MENMGLSRRKSCPKVHSSLCTEMTMMLDRVSSILPSIEAARPGCRAGIQELCNLYNIVEKGKLITQHCIECSKLYLAITGEAILARCERIRDSLRRSLFLIQNMVPTVLANQIAEVHIDLGEVKFVIDPLEEEAGKAILEMLRQSDATEELELQTFVEAASKLNLTSPKAILIERRAIKKLVDKTSGTDHKKEQVLKFFLYLVRKYGKNIKPDTGERAENLQYENQSSPSLSLASDGSTPGKCYTPTYFQGYEYQCSMSGETTPPTELCCPISTKLMHDPVIITSGQTYEREYIEKWFSEGYDTCPKTQTKLENFTMIPNTCMRDLHKSHRLHPQTNPRDTSSFPLTPPPRSSKKSRSEDEHDGDVGAEPGRSHVHPGGVPAGGGLLARVVRARQDHRMVPRPLVPPAAALRRRGRPGRGGRRRAPPRRLRRPARRAGPLLLPALATAAAARLPQLQQTSRLRWRHGRRAQNPQPQLAQGRRPQRGGASLVAQAGREAGAALWRQGGRRWRPTRHPPASLDDRPSAAAAV